MARSIGCHVDLWQMRSGTDGSLSFSLEDAERLVRPGTRLVVVNAPHNPSGCLFSREEWRALCALCDRTGAYLFRCAAGVQPQGHGRGGTPWVLCRLCCT